MATSPIYSWPEPDNTDLVKNGALAIRTLGNAIDTTMGTMVPKTIVDAKGDLIAGTAADTAARLAVGNNGETLVADSSTSTGLRWQGNYAAGKNLVTNGNMTISQRGTSFASNGSNINIYTTDRFQARNSNLGEYTITQDTDAPAGFRNSAKWVCTTADASPAAADFLLYRTKFEGQQVESLQYGSATAQTTTLSFWVKSNLTGTFICQLFTEAPSSRNISASYTINAAATWEKKTITFVGDTVGVLTTGTNLALNVIWFLGAGSDRTGGTLQTTWAAISNTSSATGQTNLGSAINNYWQITGVQWEIGNTATAFQLATGTVQGELAACQRYYQILGGDNTFEYFAIGSSTNTTDAAGVIPLKQTMRTTPTLTFAAANLYRVTEGTSANTCTVVQGDIVTKNTVNIQFTTTGLTAFRANRMLANGSLSATIQFSAEL